MDRMKLDELALTVIRRFGMKECKKWILHTFEKGRFVELSNDELKKFLTAHEVKL